MREKDLILVITKTLNSKYIGDDCAYLKDLGIVITQDSLVEDVHFKLDFMTPYQLGYKSVMVNLSDVVSSGAIPKYLTIALSLPKSIKSDFVEEFYKGAKFACGNDIEIVGGDITGSDKVFISVCAIGSAKDRVISSRKNAKIGYKVVVEGVHGSSALGLKMLLGECEKNSKFILAHLEPKAQFEFGDYIGKNIKTNYAMMDTSDGILDALSTIANDSQVLLNIDFNKIPYDKDIQNYENWQKMVLFGGEDYGIVAVLPKDFECGGIEIGSVSEGLGVNLKIDNKELFYSKQDVLSEVYNHF